MTTKDGIRPAIAPTAKDRPNSRKKPPSGNPMPKISILRPIRSKRASNSTSVRCVQSDTSRHTQLAMPHHHDSNALIPSAISECAPKVKPIADFAAAEAPRTTIPAAAPHAPTTVPKQPATVPAPLPRPSRSRMTLEAQLAMLSAVPTAALGAATIAAAGATGQSVAPMAVAPRLTVSATTAVVAVTLAVVCSALTAPWSPGLGAGVGGAGETVAVVGGTDSVTWGATVAGGR